MTPLELFRDPVQWRNEQKINFVAFFGIAKKNLAPKQDKQGLYSI